MPAPPSSASDDPTRDAGNVGDPVMACESNDVEVVCDLDEPNAIELESAFEEEEPVGLLFAATAREPEGSTILVSEESLDSDDEEAREPAQGEGSDAEDDGADA